MDSSRKRTEAGGQGARALRGTKRSIFAMFFGVIAPRAKDARDTDAAWRRDQVISTRSLMRSALALSE